MLTCQAIPSVGVVISDKTRVTLYKKGPSLMKELPDSNINEIHKQK